MEKLVAGSRRIAASIFRAVALAAVIVGLGAGAFDYYMNWRFVGFPRTPNLATGQVIPHAWKSTTIYISRAQLDTLLLAEHILFTAFGVGALGLLGNLWLTRDPGGRIPPTK